MNGKTTALRGNHLNVSAEDIERDRIDLLNKEQLALLDKIKNHDALRRPKGFGITVGEYAESEGLKFARAREKLNKYVKEGLLQKSEYVDNGHKKLVYYEVQ